MSQAFHRFQMKMKTKMTILDQELSQSAVGMYENTYFVWFLVDADSSTLGWSAFVKFGYKPSGPSGWSLS